MIEPNTPISVSLTAAQWNAVLTQLAEGPYRMVAPLLVSIQQQCAQHDDDALPPELPARGNGTSPPRRRPPNSAEPPPVA